MIKNSHGDPILVVAEHYDAYIHWLREHKVNQDDHIYFRGERTVRGRYFSAIIRICVLPNQVDEDLLDLIEETCVR